MVEECYIFTLSGNNVYCIKFSSGIIWEIISKTNMHVPVLFIKVCQVVQRLLYQKLLCFKQKKRTCKPHEVRVVPKSRGGFSTFSKTVTLLKSLKSFAIDSSTARTSSVTWQCLDFFVKAFFRAEFSIYIYCLSTNLRLTECCWLKLPSLTTELHEALLKFWCKCAKLSFFIPECWVVPGGMHQTESRVSCSVQSYCPGGKRKIICSP